MGLMAVFTSGGENRKIPSTFDCVNYGRAINYYQIHSFEKRQRKTVRPLSDSMTPLEGFTFVCFFSNFPLSPLSIESLVSNTNLSFKVFHLNARLCNFFWPTDNKRQRKVESFSLSLTVEIK